jgi:tRNA 2-selenouridine synthase SelU
MSSTDFMTETAAQVAALNPQTAIAIKIPSVIYETIEDLKNKNLNHQISPDERVQLEKLLFINSFIESVKEQALILVEKALHEEVERVIKEKNLTQENFNHVLKRQKRSDP